MASAKTPAKTAALTLHFTMEKDTPNTIRFKEDEPEDGSRPAVGTLYITKAALAPLGDFKNLTVTIEPD